MSAKGRKGFGTEFLGQSALNHSGLQFCQPCVNHNLDLGIIKGSFNSNILSLFLAALSFFFKETNQKRTVPNRELSPKNYIFKAKLVTLVTLRNQVSDSDSCFVPSSEF